MLRSLRRTAQLPGVVAPAAQAATALAVLACLLGLATAGSEPPRLQMAEAALRLPPVVGGNSSSEASSESAAGGSRDDAVLIGVQLVGAAQQPVSADLALTLPRNAAAQAGEATLSSADQPTQNTTSWSAADPSKVWLDPPQLRWGVGEAGVKWVRLRSVAELPLALVLNAPTSDAGSGMAAAKSGSGGQTVLRVHLVGASGAAIADSPLNSTEVTVEGGSGNSTAGGAEGQGSESALPLFGFIANQVAYPPANGSGSSEEAAVPVRLLAGQLTGPTTLRYKLRVLLPGPARPLQRPERQFLPSKTMQGFLHFSPKGGGGSTGKHSVEQRIVLPLAWDRIPPEAEYRLALELEGVYGARVAPQPGAVALHVFGTPAGTCPPGTALRALTNSSSSDAGQPAHGGSRGGSADEGSLAEPPVGGNGSAGFLLSPNGTVIDLSSSLIPGVHDYGAMVDADVAEVLLCMRVAGTDGQVGFGNVTSFQAGGRQQAAQLLEPAPDDVAEEACGCGDDGAAGLDGSCEYAAWELPVLPGQNVFNVTLTQQAGSNSSSSSSGDEADGQVHHATLAVVRLADPDHAELESLIVRASDGQTVMLCGPLAGGVSQARNQARPGPLPGGLVLPHLTPPCTPDELLTLNVSDASYMVSLTPELKHPDVPGIRVEVNGQVLSRDGNVAADQLQDTTAQVEEQPASGAPFLPSAFIMGLQPGGKLDVEVVVVAEDGVTTNRYPLQFVLESTERLALTAASLVNTNSSSRGGGELADDRSRGWPPSPAQQPSCTVCAAGWAAEAVNSTECRMCPPGTFAPWPQSPECRPCPPGKFAYSWGSAYCKNCIEGTYAPRARSSLCLPCPGNTTTADDGSRSCTPAVPANYTAPRYAVVVTFYVNLTGLELEDVVMRAGVNGDPEAIVSSLIRTDTASAFNISRDDVQVVSMRRVARRTLSANVTAMLGVEVPAGATEEEIAAALEVERLSADKPIEMLSEDPDRFFGRTTQALEVQVEGGVHATLSSVPGPSQTGLMWAMLAPGIVAILAGSGMVVVGCKRSTTCVRWRTSAARRLATTRLVPASQRYARYGAGSNRGSGGGGTAAAEAAAVEGVS